MTHLTETIHGRGPGREPQKHVSTAVWCLAG